MKISDVVFTAATYLQLTNITDAMESPDFSAANPSGLAEADAHELSLLVRCANLIAGELAASAFPIKKQVSVEPTNGKIPLHLLSSQVLDVLQVRDGSGASVPYSEFYDGLLVRAQGKCTVTFTVTPSACALGDMLPYNGNKPSVRLLSYGVAREYCLICGRTDDAAVWDARYVAAVEEESRKKSEQRIKPRIWR